MLVLILTALGFAGVGGLYWNSKRKKPAQGGFEYRGIFVEMRQREKIPASEVLWRKKAVDGLILNENLPAISDTPAIYAAFDSAPVLTAELRAAIEMAIDAFYSRCAEIGVIANISGYVCGVYSYPVTHWVGRNHHIASHGNSQAWRNKSIKICVMPKERGGLAGTASLVVHELGHVVKHINGDSDDNHADVEFWKVMELRVF